LKTGILNLRLPAKLSREIGRLSEKYSLSRSEIVRQALLFYLNAVENIGELIYPSVFGLMPSKVSFARARDLAVARFPPGFALVVSSSSAGGIGPKERDAVKVKGEILGKFMIRAGLMKVLSTGARPILISITLSGERKPTGDEVLKGAEEEVKSLGLDPAEAVSLSTEENIETLQTGIGVTVIGIARERELKLGKSCLGDLLVAVGRPCVGREVLKAETKNQIANLKDLLTLLSQESVHEVVPVGSRGIMAEASTLASTIGCRVKLHRKLPAGYDLNKPAGPATVLLYTISREEFSKTMKLLGKPQIIIGRLSK
jgi:hypothetical protein